MIRHFETLPTRYALDVNLDSLDVLSHQRLLNEARADQTSVSYAVRSVEILVDRQRGTPTHSDGQMPLSPQVSVGGGEWGAEREWGVQGWQPRFSPGRCG